MESSKREQLLSEMRSEARAHNRFLTPEYLLSLKPRMLAALTLPDSRWEYLERLQIIEQEEAAVKLALEKTSRKRFSDGQVARTSAKRNTNEKNNKVKVARMENIDIAGSI
jgi:lipid II:glycine glycyltransferase (peptidoglycan interpeptide bridge formation enzyme)